MTTTRTAVDLPHRMHWARWGDPDRAEPVSDSLRELVEAFLGELTDRPAVAEEEVRLPDVALGEDLLDGLRALVGDEHVHVDHAWRVARTRGKSTPDLLRMRAGDGSDAPDVVVRPASHDEVAAVVGLVRRARRRARAVRRRDLRGGRPGRPARRVRRRRRARPAADDPAGRRRRRLRHRHPRGRAARARGRGAARRARPDARPLPAVVPLRLDRRLRRHPVQRAVLGRLRPLRLDGDGAEGGHPDRRPRAGQLAGQRRRTRPARARAGLRGRVRRHHRGHPQGAPGPRGEGLRGLALGVLRGRRRRDAPAGAGGAAGPRHADRAAALRRERERGEPGPARRGRRVRELGRLPDDHRLRGHRRPGRPRPRGDHRAAGRARRGVAGHRAGRGLVRAAGSTGPTCATPCSTSACWWRPSRR